MANSMRNDKVIAGWLLLVIVSAANAASTVYMDGQCGKTIDAGSSGGKLYSQLGNLYGNYVDCTVTIEADIGRQILITFDRVDIECGGDNLKFFDGPSNLPLSSSIRTICGKYLPEDVVSTLNMITLQFKTDGNLTRRGFFIAYTSFKSSLLASCGDDEFECDNGRCIDASLKDNVHDNCGDRSDEGSVFEDTINRAFSLAVGVLVAIIVGCIVAVVLLCVCIGCLCYHCCCKQSRPSQTTYQVISKTPPQQPPMAMQPAGQPAPYGQPAAHPQGQPAYQPAPYGDIKA